MADVYDVYLGSVLLCLLLGAAASLHSAIALRDGLVVASLLSSLVIMDMLFRNPPTEPTPKAVKTLTLTGLGWTLALIEMR